MVSLRACWLALSGVLLATLPLSIASATPVPFNQASGSATIPGSTSCAPRMQPASAPADCSWSASYSAPSINLTQTGSGSSHADLSTGDVSAHAATSDSGHLPSAQGRSAASFADILTFTLPPTGSSTLTLTMTADGTFSPADRFSSAYGSASMGFFDAITGNSLGGGMACSVPNGFASPFCNNFNGAFDGGVTIADTAPNFTVNATVDLNEHPKIGLSLSVSAFTFGNATADVSDPITIHVTPGVTWTSASGLFLTNVPAPAPGTAILEPASWLLLGLGLLGLGSAQIASRARRGGVSL